MFSLSSRGIAKRLVRNKQSTPTPYRISRLPLSRSGYTTSMSVLFDCSLLRTFEIGDFRERIKHETLLCSKKVRHSFRTCKFSNLLYSIQISAPKTFSLHFVTKKQKKNLPSLCSSSSFSLNISTKDFFSLS